MAACACKFSTDSASRRQPPGKLPLLCRRDLPGYLLTLALGLACFLQAAAGRAQGPAGILSYHGSTVASGGVNANEQQITPASVNVSTFGKQFSTNITDVPDLTGLPASTLPATINYAAPAGQVYAEPLVKTAVNINTGSSPGVHDVVYVATSMDSLFAIDANGGNVLWKDSFISNASGNPNPLNPPLAANITAVPGGFGTETNSQDISPWIGITGTPVIDGSNGYIYLLAKTREVHGGDQADPHYVYTLHKVRLANGADTAAVVADTTLQTSGTTFVFNSGPYVLGAGDGAVTVGGQSRIYFNAVRQMVRPALELYNGRIYVASASHGDNQPYHGWILTYDAATLACNGAWNTTPNASQGEGGVWQGGGGVVIDSNGFIYFESGNGAFDGVNTNNVITGLDANGFPVNGNYGDCFVKLALDPATTQGNQGSNKNGWGLKIVDYFSPYNNQALNRTDKDLGSGGPTILPDSAGSAAHPHLLIGGGKEGKLYLVDRDNMGKFSASDKIVQTFGTALNGILSVPAYFNGRLYATPGYGGTTSSWPLTGGAIATGSGQASADLISFPGCSPYITANGTANGVVWIIDRGSGQLRAYDAANLSNELWTSNQNATRDALGAAVKFTCPTPFNGRVYVGTADHLVMYGPPAPPTGPPAAPSALAATSGGPSTISLSWTDNSNNENGFRIERSGDGVNFTEIATVGVNQTSYTDSGLSSQATYYYRVRAANLYNTLSFSSYTNIASATTTTVTSEQPVNLYHFDEGAGTAAADSVGGNNGTLTGASLPAWVPNPGRVGTSNLSFGGNGLYKQTGGPAVHLASDLSSTLGKTSSLLFWLKTTQKGADTHWMAPAVTGVEQYEGVNDIGWGYLNSTGHIGMAVGDSGSVLSAKPVNDGLWHHIALSRDAGTGAVKVYVDGVLSASGTLETGIKTSRFQLIGALSDVGKDGVTFAGGNYFNGQLDEVGIYNLAVDPLVVASLALPPAAPSNLAAAPASGTELDLTWSDNSTNETGYEVWSSINGGAWVKIAQLPANSVSCIDGGLSPGTSYAFFVRAVDSAGWADSNIVTASTPVPPLTPTGATAVYLSPKEVDLQWVDNATNETGYKVLRRTNNADFAQIASLPPSSTSFKDLTVQAGVSYDYHIQAYNIAGYSDFAGVSIATPSQSQFLTYLARFFTPQQMANPAITGPNADPDRDGINNLLEYAFDLDPREADITGLPATSTRNGYLSIGFEERIPPVDLTYTVQVSSDSVTWNSGPSYTTVVSVTPLDSATQFVQVRDNIPLNTVPRRFMRVQVTH